MSFLIGAPALWGKLGLLYWELNCCHIYKFTDQFDIKNMSCNTTELKQVSVRAWCSFNWPIISSVIWTYGVCVSSVDVDELIWLYIEFIWKYNYITKNMYPKRYPDKHTVIGPPLANLRFITTMTTRNSTSLRPVQTVTFFNPDSRLFLETPPTFLKLRPLLHLQTFLPQKVATFLKTNMFFIFWQKVRLFPTFI